MDRNCDHCNALEDIIDDVGGWDSLTPREAKILLGVFRYLHKGSDKCDKWWKGCYSDFDYNAVE